MGKSEGVKEPSKTLVAAAFIALYLIWGSTYLGNLYAIKTIPPFLMAGTRFLSAGIILFLWCLISKHKIPALNAVLKLAITGIMLLFMGTGAVIWVEQFIPSGITAVIVATVPLWFVALDKREWKFYFSNKWILVGLLIGFLGVLLLFAGKSSVNFTGDKMQLISFFILTAGSICWAIGSLLSKYQKVEGSTLMKAAIQMMSAGIASFLFAFLIGEYQHFKIFNVSWVSIRAVLYLVFLWFVNWLYFIYMAVDC